MSWAEHIDVAERSADRQWLEQMYNEMSELAEYPPFKTAAIELRQKIGFELVHERIKRGALTTFGVNDALIAIGSRLTDKSSDGVDSVSELLQIVEEEIAKHEDRTIDDPNDMPRHVRVRDDGRLME